MICPRSHSKSEAGSAFRILNNFCFYQWYHTDLFKVKHSLLSPVILTPSPVLTHSGFRCFWPQPSGNGSFCFLPLSSSSNLTPRYVSWPCFLFEGQSLVGGKVWIWSLDWSSSEAAWLFSAKGDSHQKGLGTHAKWAGMISPSGCFANATSWP